VEQTSWLLPDQEPSPATPPVKHDAGQIAATVESGGRTLMIDGVARPIWERPSTSSSMVVMSTKLARLGAKHSGAARGGSANQTLTIHAERLLRLALSKIEREQRDFGAILIGPKELADLFPSEGSTGKRFKNIEQAVTELQSYVVRTEEGANLTFTNLLEYCVFNRDAWRLELVFKQVWKRDLMNLRSHFFSQQLAVYTEFRYAGTFRFFELLRSYVDARSRRGEFVITIKDLLEQMNLGKGYEAYRNLRRMYLDHHISELERTRALDVKYSPADKQGLKVVALRFEVALPNRPPEEPYVEALVEGFRKWDVRTSVAHELARSHGPMLCMDKLLKYPKDDSQQGSKRTAGWIVSAVRKDYQPIAENSQEQMNELQLALGMLIFKHAPKDALMAKQAEYLAVLEAEPRWRALADRIRANDIDPVSQRSFCSWLGKDAREHWQKQSANTTHPKSEAERAAA